MNNSPVILFINKGLPGYRDFVLYRFELPDVIKGTGFLLSPYWSAAEAHSHAAELGLKEGEAVQQLLETNSGYRIFNNCFRE